MQSSRVAPEGWSWDLTDAFKLQYKVELLLLRDVPQIWHMHVHYNAKLTFCSAGMVQRSRICMEIAMQSWLFVPKGSSRNLAHSCKLQYKVNFLLLRGDLEISHMHVTYNAKLTCCSSGMAQRSHIRIQITMQSSRVAPEGWSWDLTDACKLQSKVELLLLRDGRKISQMHANCNAKFTYSFSRRVAGSRRCMWITTHARSHLNSLTIEMRRVQVSGHFFKPDAHIHSNGSHYLGWVALPPPPAVWYGVV